MEKKQQDKKYRIYFRQINQCYIDVVASHLEIAIEKAKKEWRADNPPEFLEAEY